MIVRFWLAEELHNAYLDRTKVSDHIKPEYLLRNDKKVLSLIAAGTLDRI